MSRTLTEIYNEAVETRNKYLELTELTNDSKMSIINAFTWVTAAAINGTSAYYANAMLKWQYGDDLIINDEGTAFH